jgi:sodium transport system permease protein
MFLGMGFLMGKQAAKEQGSLSKIAVLNSAAFPGMIELINADRHVRIEKVADYHKALNEGQIQAVIDVSKVNLISEVTKNSIAVIYDASNRNSKIAKDRLQKLLDEYRHQLSVKNLIQNGVDTTLINPFKTDFQNIASRSKMGGFLMGTIIPYMIVILICIGSLYPAMDITAGEKERKTIETLLVTNIGRNEIVFGKLLTVITLSLATTVFGLISLTLTIMSGVSVFSVGKIQTSLSVSPGGIAFSLLTLIPTAVVISSAMLMIGSYARTVKEGSNYGSYFMMAIIMLAMVSMTPMEATNNLFAIPVLNTALCQKELLMNVFNWHHIALSVFTSGILALLAAGLTVALFNQEKILFRS